MSLRPNRPPVVQEHFQRAPHGHPAANEKPLADDLCKMSVAKSACHGVPNRNRCAEKRKSDHQADAALPKQLASSGESPVWGKDGKEILYLDRERIWSIPVDTSRGEVRVGTAAPLFPVRSMEGARRVRGIMQLAVSRDGSRIYYQQPVEQPPDSDLIHIRMGWESAAAKARSAIK